MLHSFPSSLIEGRLRRHPEGGARSGVPRRRLVTVGPGRPGTPPARHYDLAARSSLHGSARQLPAAVGRRAPKETEARPRGPKLPRWSAERRASRVMGRKAPRNRLVNVRVVSRFSLILLGFLVFLFDHRWPVGSQLGAFVLRSSFAIALSASAGSRAR